MRRLNSFFQKHKTLLLSLLFIFLFSGILKVFAVAPSGGYAPGATLDPDCAPGDTSCLVKGSWLLTGNTGTLDDGTYYIGTTDETVAIPLNFKVDGQKAGRIDPTLFNTFFGYQAGNSNTTGSSNVANGYQALYSNTVASQNTANGSLALFSNISGWDNSANGYQALYANTMGYNNVASGSGALRGNTTGLGNTGVGYLASYLNVTGNNNTAIGSQAGVVVDGLNNTTAIGKGAEVSESNTIKLGNGDITRVITQGTLTLGSVTYPNFDGSEDQVLSTDGNGSLNWTAPGWKLNGNSGLTDGINFIGTRDDVPLNFKVNNIQAGRIDQTLQNTFFGYNSGASYTGATGSVTSLNVTNGGTGYDITPAVITIDPPVSGTTATADAVVSVDQNEIQTITPDPGSIPDGGTYIISFVGMTVPLNYNDNSTTIQNALEAIGAIGVGNVSVAGDMTTSITIEFINTMGNAPQNLVSLDSSSLTQGGNPLSNPPAVTESQGGIVGGVIRGFIMTDNGSGYTSVPGVTITGGNNDATARADVSIGTGNNNTANGTYSLYSNTTGSKNTASGVLSLASNTTGDNNVAIGNQALYSNTTGGNNTSSGSKALYLNIDGSNNTSFGFKSLYENISGNNNVALGAYAGYYETGSDAFYVDNQDRGSSPGDRAGALLYGKFDATPANQTLTINAKVGIGTPATSNQLEVLGDIYSSANITANNDLLVNGVANLNGSVNVPGIANSAGTDYLCYSGGAITLNNGSCGPSSSRFKHDIQDLSGNLDKVLALRPVSFIYNSNNKNDIGFIAEEINLIEPRLVSFESDGTTPHGLNYAQFAPLFAGAIQDLNLKINDINNFEKQNDWRDNLTAWLANATNRITRIFTGEICLTDPGEEPVCLNRTELQSLKDLLANQVSSGSGSSETEGSEKLAETPSETSTETLTESLTETPTEMPIEISIETPIEIPLEMSSDVPVETQTESPIENSTPDLVSQD